MVVERKHVLGANVLSFPNTDGEEEEVTKRNVVPGIGQSAHPETLRLSPEGSPISGNGGEELIECVAYAARITDILGELLGAEQFVSVEFSLSDGSCVIARNAAGELCVAKAGHAYDIALVREAAHAP